MEITDEMKKFKAEFDKVLAVKKNINRKFGNDYKIVKHTNDWKIVLLVDINGYYVYKVNLTSHDYIFIDYGSEYSCLESFCDAIIEEYT